MTLVLVWIADSEFAGLRESEVGIGHASNFLVALSESPIVATLDEVVGQLQHYWGPGGTAAIPMRPSATESGLALYHDGSVHGAAHGLAWELVDTRPADELAALPWLDQDERSAYLAHEILAGRLSNSTIEERDLAVSWVAFAEEDTDRPLLGIREAPFRVAQRAFLLELAGELEKLGEVRNWVRLGTTLALADGSVMVVENVSSDGGIYPTWYCVSRYLGGTRDEHLIERDHL